MKKLIASIVFVIMAMGSSYGQEIEFEMNSPQIDYGTIEFGSNGVREIKFKNTGKAPLIITNSISSCGCLVVTYPKTPIMPNTTDKISVYYDTKRAGHFTKNITLITNCNSNSETVIRVIGEVKSPNSDESVPSKGVIQR